MNGEADILVIDDEEWMRDCCRQALSQGRNVAVAEAGVRGISEDVREYDWPGNVRDS